MSENLSDNRPSPEHPYECPGIAAPQPPDAPDEGYVACYRAGHECPPKVAVTTHGGGYRMTTFRCPCCGDHGLSYGFPDDWFTSSNCRSTSADSSVTRSEVSTNLNANDPSRNSS